MNRNFSERFMADIDAVNSRLDKYAKISIDNSAEQRIAAEAMWYSVKAGGKRIRPVLATEFCILCAGSFNDALTAACAIELIHTFSLIHDDLPCMDNDDFRRGKPACHAAYGEVNALLAGDALENLAFGIICSDNSIADNIKVKLVCALSEATGMNGMIGGQVIDTLYENKMTDEILLLEMYKMKTGALLKAACKMGCICANAGEKYISAACDYAVNLGLAFQIIDDILDISGNETVLGKPVGSDAANGKVTFASLVGIEAAEKYAADFTQKSLDALEKFDGNTEFIADLTAMLLRRKS